MTTPTPATSPPPAVTRGAGPGPARRPGPAPSSGPGAGRSPRPAALTPSVADPTSRPRSARRLVVAALLAASALLGACGPFRPATAPAPTPGSGAPPAEPPAPAPPPVNPLTGLPMSRPDLLRQRPVLVSIDNHPDARPQAGLTAADLVYEVPAEGGITRLLALFVTQRPERVGPVRSSRHYFLDLALEWDAIYVHAGGSPQHYARIVRTGLDDLDGVRADPRGGGRRVFTRDARRKMPHNLYASLPVALTAAEERGWALTAPPRPSPFAFRSAGEEPTGERVDRLVIHWPGWRRGWVRYRWTGAGYLRETAFGPHVAEETGDPLTPANLLIQLVPARTIAGDAEGRLEVELAGEGRLLIASGGRLREGRWQKASPTAPTRWLEADGRPVRLASGPTWVHLVPASARIEASGPPSSQGSGEEPAEGAEGLEGTGGR